MPLKRGLQPYSIPAAGGLDDYTGAFAGVSLEIIDDDERAVNQTVCDPDFGRDTGLATLGSLSYVACGF